MSLPHYYSKLDPFRDVFVTGAPVLTYHHVAPIRRGARVKWLYHNPKLFAQQTAELREAGFSTPEFGTILEPSAPNGVVTPALVPLAVPAGHMGEDYSAPSPNFAPSRQFPAQRRQGNLHRHIYLTFDDGFCDVFQRALPILVQNRFRSMLYLVSSLVGKTNEWQLKLGDVVEPIMDVVQVREWLAAGQEIGAHTHTHPHLTQVSVAVAREEIAASKKSLEDRFGVSIEHFNYPYGEWNKVIRDLVIEAGFKTACTVDLGVNTAETSPFELKRFIARSDSNSPKVLWQRLCRRGSQASKLLRRIRLATGLIVAK
jgi:peptidoglycan/xylan/chitin deacetylase (PgdA/CDA1 family)